jgi:hypothetical protein
LFLGTDDAGVGVRGRGIRVGAWNFGGGEVSQGIGRMGVEEAEGGASITPPARFSVVLEGFLVVLEAAVEGFLETVEKGLEGSSEAVGACRRPSVGGPAGSGDPRRTAGVGLVLTRRVIV